MNGWYLVLGAIAWNIIKLAWLALDNAIRERRRKRFLTLVSVTFPDKESLTFIAVDASDRKSMKDVERQLREQFKIPEDDGLEAHYHSGGGYRN